jgi:Tfp pilus assembly protein PilX
MNSLREIKLMFRQTLNGEEGIVLIAALALLVALTLVGATAFSLRQRMSRWAAITKTMRRHFK